MQQQTSNGTMWHIDNTLFFLAKLITDTHRLNERQMLFQFQRLVTNLILAFFNHSCLLACSVTFTTPKP